MARLTVNQKAHRVLQFLLGLRLPSALKALQRHGFTAADAREGWDRLQALSTVPSGVDEESLDTSALDAVAEFESTWFPIARVCLQRHHPTVATWLFNGLHDIHRSSPLHVGEFLDRVAALRQGSPAELPSRAAYDLLVQRGLDEQIVKSTRELIAESQQAVPRPTIQPDALEQHAVEQALWAWYLEWSALARIAIKDRRVLRALGFLQTQAGAATESEPQPEQSAQSSTHSSTQ